jgi:hypothetical protein
MKNNNFSQQFLDDQRVVTLKASGRTSAITIHIMHPAAKPVQKGSTF